MNMPENATILCVQIQAGVPCVWAAVNPAEPDELRIFNWRGTGHELGNVALDKYVGTVQLENGSLVFHLFDGGVEQFGEGQ